MNWPKNWAKNNRARRWASNRWRTRMNWWRTSDHNRRRKGAPSFKPGQINVSTKRNKQGNENNKGWKKKNKGFTRRRGRRLVVWVGSVNSSPLSLNPMLTPSSFHLPKLSLNPPPPESFPLNPHIYSRFFHNHITGDDCHHDSTAFCVEFSCSHCVCADSLLELRFPPWIQRHWANLQTRTLVLIFNYQLKKTQLYLCVTGLFK